MILSHKTRSSYAACRGWSGVFALALTTLLCSAGSGFADYIKHPMAVFAGLDKVTGRIISFEVSIDETVQFGSLQITPRACFTRPPTEAPLTDAFVEVDEVSASNEYKRIFSGWMFAASPGLHGIEHAVYDAWMTDCKGGVEIVKVAPEATVDPKEAEFVKSLGGAPVTQANRGNAGRDAVTPPKANTNSNGFIEVGAAPGMANRPQANDVRPNDLRPATNPNSRPITAVTPPTNQAFTQPSRPNAQTPANQTAPQDDILRPPGLVGQANSNARPQQAPNTGANRGAPSRSFFPTVAQP
jgi:hypothetical protein